jgi:antitoxin CcdA
MADVLEKARCVAHNGNAHIMRMKPEKIPMLTFYDTTAPKRPVNLSLNQDLVAQARNLTTNLSAEVEAMLASFVEQKTLELRNDRERLKKSTDVWNDFNDRHGSIADEFSTL